MKIREITSGEQLEAWQKDHDNRERLRDEFALQAIVDYRHAFSLAEPHRQRHIDSLTRRLKIRHGVIAAVIPDLLVNEFQYAATANRGPVGENVDVRVEQIGAFNLADDDKVEQWGDSFRIHPIVREAYLKQIRDGQRHMFLARDKDGEPAGRISVVIGGPIELPNAKPGYEEPVEYASLPSEPEVRAAIGRNTPWIEDLNVMEGFRGSGVGTLLMQEAEVFLRERIPTPKQVALSVKPDNQKAIGMYERSGFVPVPIEGHNTYVTHMGWDADLSRVMVRQL